MQNQTKLFINLVALSFFIICARVTIAASINCAAASDDLEKAICGSTALLEKDRSIAIKLDIYKYQCDSNSANLITAGQKFWLRDRWSCRNVDATKAEPDTLEKCLSLRMDERLQQLTNIGNSCDLESLANTYRFVDVWYILKFIDKYRDRTVSVAGELVLQSCKNRKVKNTTAHLIGENRRKQQLRVVFKSMPEVQREFLCAQNPFSHWKGMIKTDAIGSYLYLTDVLGVELP